uniref:Uncharacterized protein n=1 Tax=Salvator merianae TaxID=96440 RepID=A0A8D0E6E7_SALMN
MEDPSWRSYSPSIINEDVTMNGHSYENDKPFSDYMWMENERMKSNQNPSAKEFVPGLKY